MNHSIISKVAESQEQIKFYRDYHSGTIVRKYNVKEAHVESYFIPSESIEAYKQAIKMQIPGTHKKYGIPLKG